MAAHRTPWWKVEKLVQDCPISPWSKFEVASPTALAPPTGQSSTCIHVYNFRPIHPIFTNKISLDSLGQAEFNAPYIVVAAPWWIFRHLGLCQKHSKCYSYHRFGPIISKLGTHDLQARLDTKQWIIVQIQNRLLATANQIRPWSRQTGSKPISQQPFDISLKSTLSVRKALYKFNLWLLLLLFYHNQTWYRSMTSSWGHSLNLVTIDL